MFVTFLVYKYLKHTRYYIHTSIYSLIIYLHELHIFHTAITIQQVFMHLYNKTNSHEIGTNNQSTYYAYNSRT